MAEAVKFLMGTQAEYNALTKKSNNTFYYTADSKKCYIGTTELSTTTAYGECTTAAATTAKVTTISGYTYADKGLVSIKFSYDVPASATININNLGARGLCQSGNYSIKAGAIKGGDVATFVFISTGINAGGIHSGYFVLLSTDTTRDFTGATATGAGKRGYVPAPTSSDYNKFLKGDGTWGSGGDTNVIETVKVGGTALTPTNKAVDITNIALGQGYGTCTTAADSQEKVVTLANYSLVTNGIVAVKFTNGVPASAALNINSKGAKNIYHKGTYIGAGVIKAGDTATFIYNGNQYVLLSIDSTSNLGALAAKDNASGSTTYTPVGSVSKPTFTGTQATITTADYTPAGTVSDQTATVTLNTDTIQPITSVGTATSCTLPIFSAVVDDATETLTLAWTAGTFSAGSVPTLGTAKTFATSVKSASVSKATFSGTKANLTATYTPAGSVSQPTFTGTQGTISVTVQ